MPGQRSRITRMCMINGLPLIKELDEFTAPDIKKTMQETRGGSFIPGEVMVGIEKMTAKLKIIGANQMLLAALGVTSGDVVQIDVKESQQDEDGLKFAVWWSLSGEVTACTESPSKMGELPSQEMEMSVSAYKKLENGKTIYEIDRNAQILDLGAGDIMLDHRRLVGLP